MYEVRCLYDHEYVTEYAYTIDEFPYDKLSSESLKGYIMKPCTFDIETSTFIDPITNEPVAFMYIWQMCVEGYVVFGRTWEEWQEFLLKLIDIIDGDNKIVCYVHNLSYEFEFMREFIYLPDVFATDKRKVLKCSNDYIEFRCSYRLSNMNLSKFIEDTPNTHHNKGVDDLDYRTLRTPTSILSPTELGYCYNDVLGLYEAVSELLNVDTLKSIPLTSTGYVRRDCRKAMKKNKKNRYMFRKTRLSVLLQKTLEQVFRGGNTASSRYMTNVVLDEVGSGDIASSYPYAMLEPHYPTGMFRPYTVENIDDLNYICDRYCVVASFIFYNIRIKKNKPIPYIPFSKCTNIRGHECYNGRVLSADILIISMTNIDYEIINSMYDYDQMGVKDVYVACRGYLPIELREQILHYFYLKSTLKGVQGMEYEYMQAKARLNAIYGMCVSKPIHNDIVINKNGEWEVIPADEETKLNDYYDNWNSFLSYQWGVFVTAVARRRLQEAIDMVGMDVVYVDTDSVKYIGDHDDDFRQLNESLINYCKEQGIQHSVEVGNKVYYLGTWEKEEPYEQFITLGAKKYAYVQNGHIGVTVAGLSKKLGAKELEESGGLKAFTNGKVFNNSGRTVAYFNNDPIHYINVNGEKVLTGSNIAIVDTTYTLGITDTMLDIIERSREDGRDC